MKLKNIIKIGSFIVAGTLPTTSQAQVYECKQCPAGTYSGGGAVTSCTPCPAGTYSRSDNATSCTPCTENTYQNLTGQSSCTSCGYFTAVSYSGSKRCKGKKFWEIPGDYTITLPAGKYRAILVGGAGGGGGSSSSPKFGQRGGMGGQLVKIFTLTRAEQFEITVGHGGRGGPVGIQGDDGTDTVLTLTSSNGKTSGIIKDKPLIAEKGIGGRRNVGVEDLVDDERSGSCIYNGYELYEGEKCYSKNKVTNGKGALDIQSIYPPAQTFNGGRNGSNGGIQLEIIR